MKPVRIALCTLWIGLSLLGACTRGGSADEHLPDAARPAAPSAVPAAPPSAALPDFTWLVKRYGAAVVNVNVVGRALQTSDDPQLAPEDPLSEFFRHFGVPSLPDRGGPGDNGQQAPLRGLGSGFIVSADGYVLTNAHVVDRAANVTVKLQDRREFPAKVVGADRRSDVAVLKIRARDLPRVELGDPSRVEPGQWVAAIGAPFGFENSVTVGVVSATARALGPQSNLVPFIQTDVAVNPGNSGGPLFNLRGEVIGINSQIYSATGGYQGISFAIPIDVALSVERQLIDSGHVTRGKIGITIQDVNAQLAQAFHLDRPRGALVNSVEPEGPAAKAGVKPGDVVLSVNGKPIETSAELPALIASIKPGSEAVLALWRNGRQAAATVRVAELKDDEDEGGATEGSAESKAGQEARFGLTVRPLTPEERKQVDTEGRIVIEQVQGPAAEAGMQPGDIILGAGDKPVRSVEDLRKATSRANGSVAFLIQRGNQQIYIPVTVAQPR